MPFTSYDAASDAIDRARDVIAATRTTGPRSRKDPVTGRRVVKKALLPTRTRADMRRLAVVMAVSALDTHMHRLIIERVYTHGELPGKLAKLDMPFEALLEQADETAAAARKPPHNSRPRVAMKRQLRDRLLRETFQNYNSVKDALGMAGRSGDWNKIGAALTPPLQPRELGRRLNSIVMRRNQIVHEGDYVRLEKPRDARLNEMSLAEAESDISFIGDLIDAIHSVVQ